MLLWLIALGAQAKEGKVSLPRRLVWIIDRRSVVDEASAFAEKILKRLLAEDAPECAVELREALAGLSLLGQLPYSEDPDVWGGPLSVTTLRGKREYNRKYLEDISRPAIIVSTVDLYGSGLFFRAYRNGWRGRSTIAGFFGQDVWCVIDEAHIASALVNSLREAAGFQSTLKPFWVTEVTATQRCGGNNTFRPFAEGEIEEDLRKRLTREKPLELHLAKDATSKMASLALQYKDLRSKVIVYALSPKTVHAISKILSAKVGHERVRVLTGNMRGYERDRLLHDPVAKSFLIDDDGPAQPETVYLLATSAGEVGSNYNAEHMICDLTYLDSMAQRLGRLNRLGDFENATADVVYTEKDQKSFDLSLAALRALPEVHAGEGVRNASPECLSRVLNPEAFRETPSFYPLTQILLDHLSLTSIRDNPYVEDVVPALLRGVNQKDGEVEIVWRAEVPYLTLTSPESIQEWFDRHTIRPCEVLSDVPSCLSEVKALLSKEGKCVVLKDNEAPIVCGADDLDPQNLVGATVILDPKMGGLSKHGLLSSSEREPVLDVADDGTRYRMYVTQDEDGVEEMVTLPSLEDPVAGNFNATPTEIPENGRLVSFLLSTSTESLVSQPTFSSRSQQTLDDHNRWTGLVAGELAIKLGMLDLSPVLRGAGQMHDVGKARACWQKSIGNEGGTVPMAKSRGVMNWRLQEGYRHEHGSVVLNESYAGQHSDLALHVVAAHHSRARPHFTHDEMDKESTQKVNLSVTLKVMGRFSELQTRYGYWGLAYLESVLKTADVLASKFGEEVEKWFDVK
jgi:CRISPR-associated endonuclease/helicase Cas3